MSFKAEQSKSVALDFNAWRIRLNELGGAREACFFVISFDAQKAYVWAHDEIPGHVYFSLPNGSRMPAYRDKKSDIRFVANYPSWDEYRKVFDQVQHELRLGNSYLLNLCFPTKLDTNLSLCDFMIHAKAPYKLMLEAEFCSFSPESFVCTRRNQLYSYPMKGTISAEQPDAEALLLNSEKELREHATIVDLLRNDLSRICSDVSVPRYRYVEQLQTARGIILQTSSEIRGELSPSWRSQLGNMLAALLPAGSITGAPKRRTLEIIEEVEPYARDFYTGVFGYFDGESLESAVSIRFIEDCKEGLVYKSGGGITSMSDAHEEYEELKQKVYVPFTS